MTGRIFTTIVANKRNVVEVNSRWLVTTITPGLSSLALEEKSFQNSHIKFVQFKQKFVSRRELRTTGSLA